MSKNTLAQYPDMIRFAADPRKFERIRKWLNNYLSTSSFWNDSNQEEVLKLKQEMQNEIDSLCKNETTKEKAIHVFEKASHYEVAATTCPTANSTEITLFVDLLEWTLKNAWVISKISSNQVNTEDVPRWLLEHQEEVKTQQALKAR